MKNMYEIAREIGTSPRHVNRAVARLAIPPVSQTPVRYLFTPRQVLDIKYLLKQWGKGLRPKTTRRSA